MYARSCSAYIEVSTGGALTTPFAYLVDADAVITSSEHLGRGCMRCALLYWQSNKTDAAWKPATHSLQSSGRGGGGDGGGDVSGCDGGGGGGGGVTSTISCGLVR